MPALPFLAPLLAAVVAVPVAANADGERYRLEKTEDGYVRMDTATGAMSICRQDGNDLVCRAAANGGTALEDEIGDLRRQVEALEKRVAGLEGSPTARLEKNLPSEEDFEKSLGYMEKFFRRFMGIVKDFEKDDPAGGAAGPESGRT